MGREIGLEFATIAQSLATFGGTKKTVRVSRRSQQHYPLSTIMLTTPVRIEVTLASGRLIVEGNNSSLQRLVAIFQPHRYSRTKTFLKEFALALQAADVVVITDIYSAGEENTFGIGSSDLVEANRQMPRSGSLSCRCQHDCQISPAANPQARRLGNVFGSGKSQSGNSTDYCPIPVI